MATSRPTNHDQELPEHRVGRALREARLAAGLSLREMARRLNYGSHSILSEYENGARMPSEAVVEGYERLLLLDAGALTRVLEAANVERHGDAWFKRRVHLPVQFVPVATGSNEFPRAPLTGPTPTTRSSAVGGGPITPDSAFPLQPVEDGCDPDAAGCSADAITVHSRRIAFDSNRVVIGHIELRYCARAKAVWGRFEGYASLNHIAEGQPGVTISISVERHSDSARQVTSEAYCFDLMWGNLLKADEGTFVARVTVLVGDEPVSTGETATCLLG